MGILISVLICVGIICWINHKLSKYNNPRFFEQYKPKDDDGDIPC